MAFRRSIWKKGVAAEAAGGERQAEARHAGASRGDRAAEADEGAVVQTARWHGRPGGLERDRVPNAP